MQLFCKLFAHEMIGERWLIVKGSDTADTDVLPTRWYCMDTMCSKLAVGSWGTKWEATEAAETFVAAGYIKGGTYW